MSAFVEPFTGTIDEVAFYDFSLTDKEIATHWQNAQAGKNYFGMSATDTFAPGMWTPTSRLHAGQAERFDAITGLRLGAVPLDRAGFGR